MRSKVTASLVLVIVVAIVAGVINYQGLIAKNPKLVPKLGLDLSGGVRIVLEAQDTEGVKATSDAIDAAVVVIDKRVNALGVSEAIAVREGANSKRIVVELPGWEDPEKAKEIIGKTALLEFKTEDGKVVVSGNNLTDAKLVFSQAQDSLGEPQIAFTLNAEGKAAFAAATQANIGKTITIYLDGKVEGSRLSRPVVMRSCLKVDHCLSSWLRFPKKSSDLRSAMPSNAAVCWRQSLPFSSSSSGCS
ncbi:MAG: preprotein translocase subunit SecD [Candidatus Cryosericum sp.]